MKRRTGKREEEIRKERVKERKGKRIKRKDARKGN